MSIKIMLDAGHTGTKWNKGAVAGYYESAVMWDLHTMLAEELENFGFVVGKTRKTIDTEMDVTKRGKAGKGYDLLLSLHSNSTSSKTTRRVACIYQTEDSQGTWDTTSRVIADKLAIAIADTMGVTWKNYSKLSVNDRDGDGKKDDNYYGVLHGARLQKVPAVIVEHSFHSNVETCNWLLNKDNLRKLARAEASCLAEHFGLKAQVTPSHEEIKPYDVKITSKSGVNVRKGPGTGYTKTGALAVNTVCTIVDESEGKGAKLWGKLAKDAGWIALDYTKPVTTTDTKPTFKAYSATIKPAIGLNVRAEASSKGKKLGALSYKTKVTILEEKGGWGRIDYKGKTGWISLQYIKKI